MPRLALSAASLLAALALQQAPASDSELLKYGSQFGQTLAIVMGCFFLFRQWISTRIDLSRQREAAEIKLMERKGDAEIATMQAESASRIRVAEGLAVRMDKQTDALDRIANWLQSHEAKDAERDGDMRAHVTDESRRTQAMFRAVVQSVSGRPVPPPRGDPEDRLTPTDRPRPRRPSGTFKRQEIPKTEDEEGGR